MKAVCAIVLAVALVLGANALPRSRQINRSVLENRLRMLLRSDLDDNLARFIDTVLRDWIVNGNEELGLPVADPLVIEKLDINLDNGAGLVLVGSVDNVAITGASTFKVVSVVTDVVALTAVIDISVDALKLVGEHYVLEGDLNGLLPLWGEGAFQLDLFDAKLNIQFQLRVKEDDFLELAVLKLDVSIGSAKANFENLLGGGALGDVANDFISSELPNLVEQNKELVLSELVPIIIEKVNPVLAKYTLDGLLDLINNTPKKA